MSDEQQPKKYNVEELRKTYPRMGMKWEKEEDERLQKRYEEFRSVDSGDFDVFVSKLVNDFGRAAGGLKARLAMHFEDVPGWDYGRDQYRKEEAAKQLEGKFNTESDEVLKQEYQKYLESKKETYISFVKRMSGLLGVEGKFIGMRLLQLVGSIEKYRKDNVKTSWSFRREKKEETEELEEVDFSGNKESLEALRVMNDTTENLFLTGEAGTGKSTLLQYFRRTAEKNVVVLAPTGVAALNVEGQTIHSFCAFGPDITPAKVKKLPPFTPKLKLLRKLNTIVIDEISMVRADLLDCVDKFLRINLNSNVPFGGLQMVFIGDLFQLPPVDKDFQSVNSQRSSPIHGPQISGLINQQTTVAENSNQPYASPYFFDSHVFRESRFQYIKLRQIYRQQDQVFIDLLNAVRNNAVSQDHLRILNNRVHSEDDEFTYEQFAVYLTTTNARARQINNFFLGKLEAPVKTYQGTANGTFEGKELPTDENLQVKVGSQVMMLNNDRQKRWVNGTMGKIVDIRKDDDSESNASFSSYSSNNLDGDKDRRSRVIPEATSASEGYPESISSDSDTILIELETGETVYVEPHTWEMFKFVLDKDTQSVDSQTTGTYTQYPFKLAWAVTIHKAQGKTFDKVYIDLSTGTFAHGQAYVALSRCRRLEGLYLQRPLVERDIILDPRVVDFMRLLNK